MTEDITWTATLIEDLKKCKDDIVYFTEKYIKITDLDAGLTTIKLYDWQKIELNNWINNRFSNCISARQIGSTTIQAIFALHQSLFTKNYIITLCYNKQEMCKHFMDIINIMYKNLPVHVIGNILIKNKHSIEFDNGSRIITTTTTSNGIRGHAVNCIIIDNLSYSARSGYWSSIGVEMCYDFHDDEIMCAAIPMISASAKGKIILCGTPPSNSCKQWNIRSEKIWNTSVYDYTHCPRFNDEWKHMMIKLYDKTTWKKEMELQYD